jgi:hypothetical protein
MPPNHPANVGVEAISGWSGGFATFDAEFALSPEEVRPTGPDWSFERGSYSISHTEGRRRSDSRRRQVHHALPASRGQHLADGRRHLEQQQSASHVGGLSKLVSSRARTAVSGASTSVSPGVIVRDPRQVAPDAPPALLFLSVAASKAAASFSPAAPARCGVPSVDRRERALIGIGRSRS